MHPSPDSPSPPSSPISPRPLVAAGVVVAADDAAAERGGPLRLRPRGDLDAGDRGARPSRSPRTSGPGPQAQLAIVSWPSEDFDVSTETAREDAITIINTWGVGPGGHRRRARRPVRHGQRAARTTARSTCTPAGASTSGTSNRDELAVVVNETMLPLAQGGRHRRRAPRRPASDRPRRAAERQPGSGGPDAAQRRCSARSCSAAGSSSSALFLRTWWERGRDAEVPLIDDSVLMPVPPPGLTPALATVLRNDGVDKESFTSALVDLGHRGLVTFEQADGRREAGRPRRSRRARSSTRTRSRRAAGRSAPPRTTSRSRSRPSRAAAC